MLVLSKLARWELMAVIALNLLMAGWLVGGELLGNPVTNCYYITATNIFVATFLLVFLKVLPSEEKEV